MALTPKKQTRLPGGLLLILLCLLSFILMTVYSREGDAGPLHKAKAAVEVVTMPLKTIGSIVSSPFRALGNYLDNSAVDAATVQELRDQVNELRSQLTLMEEYRQENERLLALLDLKDAYNLDAVGARVISASPDSWHRIITINKGSAAGIEIGMPVLNANGLIGQVESVSLFSSTVRLITDADSGVSVYLQNNRAEGILSGSIDGVLYLEYITLDIPVNIGDTVITSGTGGVFPKGIQIGVVSSVEYSKTDVYQTITVKPFARVVSYEEVLVIVGNESQVGPKISGNEVANLGE